MNKPTHTFKAIIKDGCSLGAYINIPFDVELAYSKKRVRIDAEIEEVAYKGVLTKFGQAGHILALRKTLLEVIDKGVGNEIAIQLSPRKIND